MIILTDHQQGHGQIKKCQGDWNYPKQLRDPCRKDEIEPFILQTNGAHKFLRRIQVEYKNRLQKYIKIAKKL